MDGGLEEQGQGGGKGGEGGWTGLINTKGKGKGATMKRNKQTIDKATINQMTQMGFPNHVLIMKALVASYGRMEPAINHYLATEKSDHPCFEHSDETEGEASGNRDQGKARTRSTIKAPVSAVGLQPTKIGTPDATLNSHGTHTEVILTVYESAR